MTSPLTRATRPKIYPEFGIEDALDELLGSQVPTNCDALRHFYFFSREEKRGANESYNSTASGLLKRWVGSNVPLLQPNSVADRVKALHTEIR